MNGLGLCHARLYVSYMAWPTAGVRDARNDPDVAGIAYRHDTVY
jgi:hypothetical protein